MYRFQKENRLLNAADFTAVFKKAHRSRDKWFIVLSRSNDVGRARLGLAISKKNCRHATARNRLKRIVRESFRQQQAELAGLDLIVMNQPKTHMASNGQLFASLHEHWRRSRAAHTERGMQDRQDG